VSVRRLRTGLVACSGERGVDFAAASFAEFVTAHVAQLPAAEQAEALAYLSRLTEQLAGSVEGS
jgi:hypothetical protein